MEEAFEKLLKSSPLAAAIAFLNRLSRLLAKLASCAAHMIDAALLSEFGT